MALVHLKRIQRVMHVKNIDPCLSKRIVTEAERTGRGLSLQQLKGIRDRVRLRKPQRVALHSWAFTQGRRSHRLQGRACRCSLAPPRRLSTFWGAVTAFLRPDAHLFGGGLVSA